MENSGNVLSCNCSFAGVRPIIVDLPYPEIQAAEGNRDYANLLSNDYAGAVSELSAITQYVNHETRMACERCSMAKTMIGIAMAEMMHLQMLGELIFLLGGNVDFAAKMRNGQSRMWTPQYLNFSSGLREMLIADIESEKKAVNQYRAHRKMIGDRHVGAVLARIIQDEEYHILILQSLLREVI